MLIGLVYQYFHVKLLNHCRTLLSKLGLLGTTLLSYSCCRSLGPQLLKLLHEPHEQRMELGYLLLYKFEHNFHTLEKKLHTDKSYTKCSLVVNLLFQS